MEPSVFRSLLGPQLDEVGGALRRFSDVPQSAEGSLTVTHHPGRMARFFIKILKLPAAGTLLPTRIAVQSNPQREIWQRSIGRSRLRTQHRAVGTYLEERVGLFRFLHQIYVENGAMKYHQEKVFLLGIPLPHTFSPIIDATASGDEKGWELDLTVSCPRCGPICQYKGWIEPK
ncbi:MAG TPA: DUF4166 domain-containing protein [Fimbriimonadaceae bacterium]|nr:hypothetical protein [Armatimonadota bacterium]HCM72760.1 hypothetical protein [Armatimonadota bacterium]HRD30613.1 DUF4166 domain-containing protein [Fimbriimonadaceae bacterium]HRE92726.1 DUF4166 domain-containing protein [Fimbriimonadaceae bacterium]HRI74376.1 DUF4166 domain-containing protein [Fimbriimonadaceae bacterium]